MQTSVQTSSSSGNRDKTHLIVASEQLPGHDTLFEFVSLVSGKKSNNW